VLEGKAGELCEQGKGKRPNKAKSLTKEEEETLWENDQLGNQTPPLFNKRNMVAAFDAFWLTWSTTTIRWSKTFLSKRMMMK